MRLQFDVAIAGPQRRLEVFAGAVLPPFHIARDRADIAAEDIDIQRCRQIARHPSVIVPLTLSAAMLPPGASHATVIAVAPDTLCARNCDTWPASRRISPETDSTATNPLAPAGALSCPLTVPKVIRPLLTVLRNAPLTVSSCAPWHARQPPRRH